MINPKLLEFARNMRRSATDVESLMWQILRARRFMDLKFRCQHVVQPYIVDFYCHEVGLVVEIDGLQHGLPEHQLYDAKRTEFLEALSLTVMRYWNHDVLGRTDVVLEDLWIKCSELKNTSP